VADPGTRVKVLDQGLAGIGADRKRAAEEGLDLSEPVESDARDAAAEDPSCRPEDVRDVFLSCQALQRRYGLQEEEQGVYVATPLPDATTRRVTFRQDVLDRRRDHVGAV
jgi:hypothetical protein